MTDMSPELVEALRQRIMHRTSHVEAMAYQYGITMSEAEDRYDADTATLAETGQLPDLPPSPDVSGTDAPHDEPDVVAEAAAELAAAEQPEPAVDDEETETEPDDESTEGGGTDG